MSRFDECLALVLAAEGGFVDHPRDPGGMTNLGVTRATWQDWVGREVTRQEMLELTPSLVAPLYEKRYWQAVKADELPVGIDYLAFDFAVNAGPSRAIRTLQKAVGVLADGAIGPATLTAVKAYKNRELQLIDKFTDQKMDFYRHLPTFNTFGGGWRNRAMKAKNIAIDMILKAPV